MKRLLLLLCICIFMSACKPQIQPADTSTIFSQSVESTNATALIENATAPMETTVPATTAVPTETTVPETTAPPPETTVAETFPTLPAEVTLEDLFTIIWDETLTWKAGGKEMVFTCPVPELLPFSEDAVRVNGEIQKTLWGFIEREKENMKFKQSKSYVSVGYQTYLNGSVLSVMTWAEDDHNKTVYNAWNLDLETGKQLTEPELVMLLGLSQEQYDELVLQSVTEAFYERCGDGKNFPDPEFYQQQFEACLSQENLAKAKLYFGEAGEAILIAPIIAVAGASNYPTLIPLDIP